MKIIKKIVVTQKNLTIVTIITFLIGCFFLRASLDAVGKSRIFLIFIGYLPFIIFFNLTLINYKLKENEGAKTVIKVLAVFSTIPLFLYYLFVCFAFLVLCLDPIEDPKYYKNKVHSNYLLKAFPKEIPEYVDNVIFYYTPRFLQGGNVYLLYYVDKNLSVDKIQKKFKDISIYTGYYKDYKEYKKESEEHPTGLPDISFYKTPAEYNNEDDFYIYLINGKCDYSGYCNHGEYLAVAYNNQTNEIMYREEDW